MAIIKLPHADEEIRFKGTPVSPGVAFGQLLVYSPDEVVVKKRSITSETIPHEIARLEVALLETKRQLEEIREKLSESLGEKEAAIFEAHLLVIDDPALLEGIRSQLQTKLLSVDYLYQQTTMAYARKMRELDDEYLQERVADVVDVSRRVLRNLQGGKTEFWQEIDQKSIIYAHDMTPSDTAMMDRTLILGFVTEVGSQTSHTAIMARSLNVPAIVGIERAAQSLRSGMKILIDGYDGVLILNPSDQTQYEYGQLEDRRHALEIQLEGLRSTLAITNDKRHIIVSANVELPEDLPLVSQNGAEGIGLFRSEFLYLNRDDFPSEEEQVELYRRVAQSSFPHNAIIRTLDVGGDKQYPYLGIEEEENPFLGWRGIRYLLGRKEVFKTQLRAICRASQEGNVHVMFPMITDVEEVKEARKIFDEACAELQEEGYPLPPKIEVGIMVETPSAAMTADLLAREVDFFSIGTNDLIQYTLAVDRNNQRVSNLYEPTHPAVLRLLKRVVDAAHENGIWVGVCGEIASDIILTPMLIGLGVDELSLGSVFIPRIKWVIQSLNYEMSRSMVEELLKGTSAKENLQMLHKVAQSLYPEIL